MAPHVRAERVGAGVRDVDPTAPFPLADVLLLRLARVVVDVPIFNVSHQLVHVAQVPGGTAPPLAHRHLLAGLVVLHVGRGAGGDGRGGRAAGGVGGDVAVFFHLFVLQLGVVLRRGAVGRGARLLSLRGRHTASVGGVEEVVEAALAASPGSFVEADVFGEFARGVRGEWGAG